MGRDAHHGRCREWLHGCLVQITKDLRDDRICGWVFTVHRTFDQFENGRGILEPLLADHRHDSPTGRPQDARMVDQSFVEGLCGDSILVIDEDRHPMFLISRAPHRQVDPEGGLPDALDHDKTLGSERRRDLGDDRHRIVGQRELPSWSISETRHDRDRPR